MSNKLKLNNYKMSILLHFKKKNYSMKFFLKDKIKLMLKNFLAKILLIMVDYMPQLSFYKKN